MIKFSVILPARNEEAALPGCLDSIRIAARPYASQVETILVLNRCTDATESIGREAGCRIVTCDGKNLSRIRNTGLVHARGEILLTIDADSRMTRNMFIAVEQALQDPQTLGGGVWIQPERLSLGIVMSGLLLMPILVGMGLSAGLFWLRRKDALAIGGFDETRYSAEDIHFARAMRRYARATGRRTRMLYRAYIRTSCRKFDHFGDWYMVRRPWLMASLLRGRNRAGANQIWYDVKR